MSTPTRVLLFAVGLVAVFALAFALGRVAGPDTAPPAQHEPAQHETGPNSAHTDQPARAADVHQEHDDDH